MHRGGEKSGGIARGKKPGCLVRWKTKPPKKLLNKERRYPASRGTERIETEETILCGF